MHGNSRKWRTKGPMDQGKDRFDCQTLLMKDERKETPETTLAQDAAAGRSAFSCDCCGSCCRHLRLFGAMYAFLDNGNGVCRHFDAERNLCSIYAERPLICRVEEGYPAYFRYVPWEEYIRGTFEGCRRLKELDRIEHGEA